MESELEDKHRPYTVLVTSESFGVAEFRYEDLNEALEGLTSLVLKEIKTRDRVERWYRILPTDEVKE